MAQNFRVYKISQLCSFLDLPPKITHARSIIIWSANNNKSTRNNLTLSSAIIGTLRDLVT